jgi:hypothetical protein
MVGMCNIPTFDQYMFRLPNSLSVCKKCVNICEVYVSSLGFRVNYRLGGYISWFYIDSSFFCCYNDSTKAYKVIIFCSI